MKNKKEFESQFNHMLKLISLQKTMQNFDDLVHPKRKFIREGELTLVEIDSNVNEGDSDIESEEGRESDGEQENVSEETTEGVEEKHIEGHGFLLSDYLLFVVNNQDERERLRHKYVFYSFYPLAFIEEVDISEG